MKKNHTLFFESISKLATIFGIVPCYNYKNKKLVHEKLYRCYSFVLALFALSCSLASICFHCLYGGLTFTILVINCVCDIFGIALYLSLTLGSSVSNTKIWGKLINKLSKSVNLNSKEMRNRCMWKSPFVHFAIGTCFYIYFIVYQMLLVDITIAFKHITSIWLHYIKFVLISLMFSIILSIKDKYQDLNGMLRGVNPNVSNKTNVKIIHNVRKLSLQVDSLVETFNSYFGWPILLLIVHSAMQILNGLSFFTSRITAKIMISVKLNFALFTHLLSNVFVISLLTVGCDIVHRATREIFNHCCDLKASVPMQSKEADELDKLQAVIKKQTKLNAAGFFQINRSLLLSVASAITTYMIVIIQFDSLK